MGFNNQYSAAHKKRSFFVRNMQSHLIWMDSSLPIKLPNSALPLIDLSYLMKYNEYQNKSQSLKRHKNAVSPGNLTEDFSISVAQCTSGLKLQHLGAAFLAALLIKSKLLKTFDLLTWWRCFLTTSQKHFHAYFWMFVRKSVTASELIKTGFIFGSLCLAGIMSFFE